MMKHFLLKGQPFNLQLVINVLTRVGPFIFPRVPKRRYSHDNYFVLRSAPFDKYCLKRQRDKLELSKPVPFVGEHES